MGKETKNYPDGAKYVWNPEVAWAIENLLKQSSPKQKQDYIDLVKVGQVGIDGNYAHLNTSVCSDEELVRYFNVALRLGKLTGTPVTSMVQIDVPGATWGLPLAASMIGIKGIIAFPNGFGGIHRHFERPFIGCLQMVNITSCISKNLDMTGVGYGRHQI